MGGANNIMIDKTGTMTKCNLRVTQAYLQGDIEAYTEN
jgi:magnesium-transporting ATPase (P-type)